MSKLEKASEKAFKVKNALPLAKINAIREQISLALQASYGLKKSRA